MPGTLGRARAPAGAIVAGVTTPTRPDGTTTRFAPTRVTLLVAVLALVAALLTTPVGAEWAADGRERLADLWSLRPGWVDDSASQVRRWVEGLTT